MDIGAIMLQLLEGVIVTLEIFGFTLIFSIPLGLLVAKGRMSKNIIVSSLFRVYISILRGTPLMLQLLLVYFGPYYLFKVKTGDITVGPFDYRFIATIIGFSLNYAAYFAEIFRGGIQSISKGQYEAAQVLGFSKSQTYFRIILPQAFPFMLEPYKGEIVSLIKATSIVGYIAVLDLAKMGDLVRSRTYEAFFPLISVMLIYFALEGIVGLLVKFLSGTIKPRKEKGSLLKGVHLHD
jgi:polar amino acid transport system permease protein